MHYLVSTVLFGAIVWWFALGPGRKAGDHLNPLTRKLFGALAGGAGILLALKGRWDFSIVLISLSAWLLGLRLPGLIDPIGRARRAEIRTPMLQVSIDMGDGSLEAKVLAGAHAGRKLTKLGPKALTGLARELAAADPQGLALVAEELDRRAPGWREHVQFDTHARQGAAPVSGEMRHDEAYQILGLDPGAGEEAVRAAHRTLIARFHPDRGGSTYLAALVNRAKDVAIAGLRGR